MLERLRRWADGRESGTRVEAETPTDKVISNGGDLVPMRALGFHATRPVTDSEISDHLTRLRSLSFAEGPGWADGKIPPASGWREPRPRWALYLAAGLVVVGALAGIVKGGLNWGYTVFCTLVAGALMWNYFRAGKMQQRFAGATLSLEPCPVRLGDALRAVVETGLRREDGPPPTFDVRVRCVAAWSKQSRIVRTGGYGRDPDTRHTKTHWEDRREVLGHTTARSDFVQVALDIPLPREAPETRLDGVGDRIRWEIELSARLEGVDYSELFVVPVLHPSTAIALPPPESDATAFRGRWFNYGGED